MTPTPYALIDVMRTMKQADITGGEAALLLYLADQYANGHLSIQKSQILSLEGFDLYSEKIRRQMNNLAEAGYVTIDHRHNKDIEIALTAAGHSVVHSMVTSAQTEDQTKLF